MYHDTEILGEGYNERYGFDEYDPYDPFGDYERNDFDDYMLEYYEHDDIPDFYTPDIVGKWRF